MSTIPFKAEGVIPACLLPFDTDFSIDEPAFRKHLRDLAGVRGVAAITVNGHSCEVHALNFDEQRRVMAVARDELGAGMPLVAGVYADGSLEAARIARMAEAGGASGLLVFPPNTLAMGGQARPEMALRHFATIAEASALPIILFQYPMAGGLGYPHDTLIRLCEEIPTIVAIKDMCGEPMRHERHICELHALSRPVNVISTHSSWLMSSLVLGCRGVLSGAGSVIADLQVALWEAVQAGDLPRAQAVNDRIYPVAQAFYAPPFLDMHNRMKEVLVHIGRMKKAVVRPPLVKLPEAEIRHLVVAAEAAGLAAEGARDIAA